MIGYKRRLSVCGSNCCGNAPRLDDPPSIHSHSQKTHTTDHRKRTRYHKLKQSPKKESHNMPQICVNKKYMLVKERHQTGTQEGGLTEFFSEKAKAIKTQNLCPVICNKSLKQNCADSQKKK